MGIPDTQKERKIHCKLVITVLILQTDRKCAKQLVHRANLCHEEHNILLKSCNTK
uniref:Gpm584 n=1 Tax=Arundo donax TaxID=35708 RepID=A0A0A9G5S0_ARUDO